MVETVTLIGEGLILAGVGGAIALERRCLGQMALAQPLLLCWVAGWASGQSEAGLWLGVCLQLFSVLPRRGLDWATAGLVAASALFLSPALGITVVVGSPSGVAILLFAATSVLVTSVIERRISRIHACRLAMAMPWNSPDPSRNVARLVRANVARWWVVGTAILAANTAGALLAAAILYRVSLPTFFRAEIAAVGTPALAMAVALGATARPRLILWSAAGAMLGLGALLL